MTIVVVTHDETWRAGGSRRVNMKDGRLFGGSEAALPAASKARIAASGITAHDLFAEAIAGVIARPARMALTVLGIVIGMSALVATIGLTRTAGNRIISQSINSQPPNFLSRRDRNSRPARLIREPFHGTHRNGWSG